MNGLRHVNEVLHKLQTIKICFCHCSKEIIFVSDYKLNFGGKWAKLQTKSKKLKSQFDQEDLVTRRGDREIGAVSGNLPEILESWLNMRYESG